MQTFLPYSNFRKSAQSLDMKRLGKQRVENYQIMLTLATDRTALGQERKGWPNHPAVRMWQGYEASLLDYQEEIVAEWVDRNYLDTCWPKTLDVYETRFGPRPDKNVGPPWLGNDEFHLSHQSSLIRKMPAHYGPLFPDVPDDIEYVWPVQTDGGLIYE